MKGCVPYGPTDAELKLEKQKLEDKALIERAMKALDRLADAITFFQCASEYAARGNTEAAGMAVKAKAHLIALLDPQK